MCGGKSSSVSVRTARMGGSELSSVLGLLSSYQTSGELVAQAERAVAGDDDSRDSGRGQRGAHAARRRDQRDEHPWKRYEVSRLRDEERLLRARQAMRALELREQQPNGPTAKGSHRLGFLLDRMWRHKARTAAAAPRSEATSVR
jgi:hypothetical protein